MKALTWQGVSDVRVDGSDVTELNVLGPISPSRAGLARMARLRQETLLLARTMIGSIEAFGTDVFEGASRPTAWLAGASAARLSAGETLGRPPV
jgi:hypothetical protein